MHLQIFIFFKRHIPFFLLLLLLLLTPFFDDAFGVAIDILVASLTEPLSSHPWPPTSNLQPPPSTSTSTSTVFRGAPNPHVQPFERFDIHSFYESQKQKQKLRMGDHEKKERFSVEAIREAPAVATPSLPVTNAVVEKPDSAANKIPAPVYVVTWIALSSSVILFNKWILDKKQFRVFGQSQHPNPSS